MYYFLIGSPGSGKTTIASYISAKYKIKHISFRDLVHNFMSLKKQSFTPKKDWLNFKPFNPNDAFKILDKFFQDNNNIDFILEGYPKSKEEAILLRKFLEKIKKIKGETFLIDTEPSLTLTRLENRLVCQNCSYISSAPNLSKILGNYCPNCHKKLIRRQDDVKEKIKYRIKRYANEKESILSELKKVTKIHKINGSGPLAEVISDIIEKIDTEKDSSTKEAERGARMFIEGINLDLANPNIIRTPERLVKTFKELTSGITPDAQNNIRKLLETTFPTSYKGMIILEPIKITSICSHHLLPIEYDILFGYIPKELSLGFSKIIKTIKIIGAQPTLQEDFTQEIIDTFNEILKPKGIMIVVRGKHSCMSIRGEKSSNVNITSALRGEFKISQKTRDEFLALAKFA